MHINKAKREQDWWFESCAAYTPETTPAIVVVVISERAMSMSTQSTHTECVCVSAAAFESGVATKVQKETYTSRYVTEKSR